VRWLDLRRRRGAPPSEFTEKNVECRQRAADDDVPEHQHAARGDEVVDRRLSTPWLDFAPNQVVSASRRPRSVPSVGADPDAAGRIFGERVREESDGVT